MNKLVFISTMCRMYMASEGEVGTNFSSHRILGNSDLINRGNIPSNTSRTSNSKSNATDNSSHLFRQNSLMDNSTTSNDFATNMSVSATKVNNSFDNFMFNTNDTGTGNDIFGGIGFDIGDFLDVFGKDVNETDGDSDDSSDKKIIQ